MKSHARALVVLLAAGCVALVAACAADGIVGTNGAPDASLRAPALIQCPTNHSASATALVGPLGGLVSVEGTSIQIPAGALLSPATVTVTIPASPLMEVDISVAGVEHFVFELPVAVTLSYARCARGDIDLSPLSVWYIDSETKALLEPMGGIDNKLLRTVTFTTGHLSGYAVAN